MKLPGISLQKYFALVYEVAQAETCFLRPVVYMAVSIAVTVPDKYFAVLYIYFKIWHGDITKVLAFIDGTGYI